MRTIALSILSLLCGLCAHAQNYTIGIAEQQNCTVTLSPQKDTYSEGEEITVTLTPASGAVYDYFEVYYQCTEDEWWVAQSANAKPHRILAPRRASSFGDRHRLEIWNLSGHEDEPVEVAEGSTYTFTMPARNVEIEAFFTGGSSAVNTITVEQTTGGTTSVDMNTVSAGTTVTIMATPADGYSACEVLVYEKETVGGAIYETLLDDVTRIDNTHFSFTMPANSVRVKVIYRQILEGDVNRDGFVNIVDVTALVDIILGRDNTEPFLYDHIAADVDHDDSITITDVTTLVNIILDSSSHP